MKVVINTTHINLLGGVSNHFKGLKSFWNEDIKYNYIGGRYRIPGAVLLPFDLLKFLFKIIFFSPDLVLLNPSLGKRAIQRDAVYLWLAKLFDLPVIVFFHGWDENIAKEIDEKPELFIKKFKEADALILLADEFKKKVKRWGYKNSIFLTTTKVDDKIISKLKLSKKKYGKNILFLARVEKEKGIFTTLDIFKELQENHPDIKLTVAGDGSALSTAKAVVKNKNIKNVDFTGFIGGSELINTFLKSDIYLFPTQHGEGMPTSVLEGMAFGLVVITRPVGGITDFFEDGKMGYLIEDISVPLYVRSIKKLIEEPKRLAEIGKYNHNFAVKHFLASKVAVSLESIFREIASEKRKYE